MSVYGESANWQKSTLDVRLAVSCNLSTDCETRKRSNHSTLPPIKKKITELLTSILTMNGEHILLLSIGLLQPHSFTCNFSSIRLEQGHYGTSCLVLGNLLYRLDCYWRGFLTTSLSQVLTWRQIDHEKSFFKEIIQTMIMKDFTIKTISYLVLKVKSSHRNRLLPKGLDNIR